MSILWLRFQKASRFVTCHAASEFITSVLTVVNRSATTPAVGRLRFNTNGESRSGTMRHRTPEQGRREPFLSLLCGLVSMA